MSENEMQIEKAYAREVSRFFDFEINRLQKQITDYKAEIKVLGEDFKMDNPNGGMYSGMELTETHHEMEKQMIYAEEAKNDVYFYAKLRKSPYFGKVVFRSKSGAEKSVYIGLRTLQHHDTFKMLVCDWRAPVSALFYEDFDGKASFDAPRGKIYCDLLLKRQFKFDDGELCYYVDSDLKIDDDILREVLSAASGEHLKVIVNSIQREQNKVIRYSDGENLLVSGPAGSGKTSVGFHRLAYLLYQNRQELSSAEIIMFSNNDIFAGYVADIIPELGEMPINYASFYSIFAAEIPTVPTGDYYALADSVITGDASRLKSAAFKMSEEFLNYIDSAVESLLPEFADIKVHGNVILSKEQLLQRFCDDAENSPKSRGGRLASFAQGCIDEYFVEHKMEIYKIENEETSVDQDTGKAVKRLRREVKNAAVEMIRSAVVSDPVRIYFNILKQYADEHDFPELLTTTASLKNGFLEFEDALCTVYVKTCLGTCAVLGGVKHILIDEAQDFSFVQHKIIRRMFPRAKFTLLCDTNQALVPQLNTTDADALARFYRAKTLKLNKSYRSTKQINDFALTLLPENEQYEIFERNGDEVEFCRGDIEGLCEQLQSALTSGKTVAVITKTSQEAREIYKELKRSHTDLRLCDNKSCEMGSAPIVIGLPLTKGLEFDSVIVADKDGAFTSRGNERFLYLASTRALHKLKIYSF